MSSNDLNLCFICGNLLSDGVVRVVKEKGIKTLIETSFKRKHSHHENILKGLTCITVHDCCYKSYTNLRMIEASVRREAEGKQTQLKLRSFEPSFDFKSRCFMCGEEISRAFLDSLKKTKISQRKKVIQVQTLNLRRSIELAAEKRGDEWGKQIIERLKNEDDLIAAGGQYHIFCQRQLFKPPSSRDKRGRNPCKNVDEAMEQIINYLEENSYECQFSLEELTSKIEGDFIPDVRTIKARLFQKYGDEVLFAENSNRKTIVCFRKVGYKVLIQSWYEQRKSDPEEEKLRIVETAADIIRGEIRSQVYENEYMPPDNFMGNVSSVIPKSLLHFFERVILEHKRGSLEGWRKKCFALSHAVIAAVRPRSFVSSILNGIGVYLYKSFGSKHLIDVLAAFGFSSSYSEASLLELSTIMQSEKPVIQKEAFCQFVFDNADFNVNTLDGLGTFHAMGGIMTVTPYESVKPDGKVARIKSCSTTELIERTGGNTELLTLRKSENTGLKNITIKNVHEIQPLDPEIFPSDADVIWLYGKNSNVVDVPGWNGFMENATKDKLYNRSKVICLPFINNPPTQYDTIYTALRLANDKCKANNQKTCFVTFDQPLYIKAQDITRNCNDTELKNIVLRLGGFHLLMSFMGAIGTIMAGSGLKELLSTVYAENSTEKIMSGHAYSRAVRAHILVHLVLAKLFWEKSDLTEDEKTVMENILTSSVTSSVLTNEKDDNFETIKSKFKEAMYSLASHGPTAKLWVQYFRMVTLIKQFIEAERMGSWHLHLACVKKMLPFFHASGHLFYAKCAHLYFQDMSELQTKMDPVEYDKFTTKGWFTIRRSEKFWSGIWTDQTIEQTLMRMMKTSGGLTGGRGITESVLTRWILGMVYLQSVCFEVEKFCGITSVSSEQHVDMRPARVIRDSEDAAKLHQWFNQHYPFPRNDAIMSISSGIVGGVEVNCHLSEEIGNDGLARIFGNNFQEVKFKRKDKVVTLANTSSKLKIGNLKLTVDPFTLFHRLCIVKQSDDDLKDFFKYELSPYPTSLFSEEGMRKGIKSSFYEHFTPHTTEDMPDGTKLFIVDGGHMLHKVVWRRHSTFEGIANSYIKYLQYHYGTNVVVIFDGYPTDNDRLKLCTKNCERLRRATCSTPDIVFDQTTVLQCQQENFLANSNNKRRLIELLKNEMGKADILVEQAIEDADVLIVETAISKACHYDSVFIVGEDVDLLILLTALPSPHKKNVFLQKCGRGKIPDTVYSSRSFRHSFTNALFFLHAFSGCDTTSALFGHGKNHFCSLILKQPELEEETTVFLNPQATPQELGEAGERFLVRLYGGDPVTQNLDDLRYHNFVKAAARTKLNLARLPPTRDAAQLHAMRTYHQVQTWLGEGKDPLKWGWVNTPQGLFPLKTMKDPAPASILQSISCTCTKACLKSCGCRKSGLNCSSFCKNCNGQSCENTPPLLILGDMEDEDAPENIAMASESIDNGIKNRTQTSETETSDINCPCPYKRKKL